LFVCNNNVLGNSSWHLSLTTHFTERTTWDKVVYNKINVNIGGAYNNGVFICPLDGVYEFIWISFSHQNRSACTVLFLNGKRKKFNYSNETTCKTHFLSTTSQIFQLKKGDRVWIASGKNQILFGDYNSSFQGNLLHAD